MEGQTEGAPPGLPTTRPAPTGNELGEHEACVGQHAVFHERLEVVGPRVTFTDDVDTCDACGGHGRPF